MMEVVLTAKEVADLKGCSARWVRELAERKKVQGQKRINADGSPEWIFPISALEPDLQQKYFHQIQAGFPVALLPEGVLPERKASRPLDHYTAEEREEITWWLKTVDDWQRYRSKYPGSKAAADDRVHRPVCQDGPGA